MMAQAVGRIRRRATFVALARPDGRAGQTTVRVAYSRQRDPGWPGPQVAYAVGRRAGSAVARNRLRRRLRAAVREVADELAPGSYVLTGTAGSSGAPFGALVSDVRQAMTTAGRKTQAEGLR